MSVMRGAYADYRQDEGDVQAGRIGLLQSLGAQDFLDPVALGQFWRQWQALSVGQREQALAPVANKLPAFLGRRSLRNILCQEEAPDFERIIRERKLVLVSLPTRTLGDAADLVGSVLVHRLWQAAQ